LRKWREQEERKRNQQPPPDFARNPDQRLQFERSQFQAALVNSRLQQSRFLAERDFGADLVNEAYAFYDKNPQLSHQFMDHPSPFHAAVDFYKKQKLADEIGGDPEAWKTKQLEGMKEQLRQELLAEMQGQAPGNPKPPASLSGAPAAGRAGEQAPKGSAFDAAFGG